MRTRVQARAPPRAGARTIPGALSRRNWPSSWYGVKMPAFSSAALFALPWPMPGTIERSSLISALMKPARRSSFTADVAPMLKGILE